MLKTVTTIAWLWIAAAVAVATAGCSFTPHPPAGKITCATRSDCPDDLVCADDHVCRIAAVPDAAADHTTGVGGAVDGPAEAAGTGGQGGTPGTGGAPGAGGDGGVDQAEVAPPDWPVCTPPATQPDLNTGLMVYLRLDETGANPVITDSSSYHSEVMVNGLPTGASWRSGRFGGALSLSGGGWIAVGSMMPSLALNAISDGISLSVWAKFPPGTPPDGVLIARRTSGSTGYLYRISISSGRPRLELYPGNATKADVRGNHDLPTDGRWMHLGATYNDTGSGIELYANGESFGKAAFALQFPAELTALTIGAEENAAAPMPTTTIDGRLTGAIDEVAIYNRVLTADQMKALACGARPTVSTPRINGTPGRR